MSRRKSAPLSIDEIHRLGHLTAGGGTGERFTGWKAPATSCRTCTRCEGERASGRIVCSLGHSVRVPDPGCSQWRREAGADTREEVYG